MKRRDFLKTLGAAGASAFLPSTLNFSSLYRQAHAIDYSAINVTAPAVMPQVINIFLYGGASELAGNLTNIADINTNSVNSYEDAFGSRILIPDDNNTGNNGFITPAGFWRGEQDPANPHLDLSGNNTNTTSGAGGRYLQFMLDQNYMTVYRTIMKRLDGTRSHRVSLLMSQKGSLDVEDSPGVGTRLAGTLIENRADYEGTTLLANGNLINNIETDLLLPFIAFDSSTRIFQSDFDTLTTIPLLFSGVNMDSRLRNPFARGADTNATALDALVTQTLATVDAQRYDRVRNALNMREDLALQVAAFDPTGGPNPDNDFTLDASGNSLPTLAGADATANGGSQLTYPNNNFSRTVRAAVTMAVENPSSLFITVSGSSGLGGWDDHNNGADPSGYRERMDNLFRTIQAAMLHIKYSNGTTPGMRNRTTTDNIIINVHGDFGRLVNLNGSLGWDHANNQNLYTFGGFGTFGGAPVTSIAGDGNGGSAPRVGGKVVGTTERVGSTKQNNQFTSPVAGSYEAEPMAIASSIYSYFGVTNPQVLTAGGLDNNGNENTAGVDPLDETA